MPSLIAPLCSPHWPQVLPDLELRQLAVKDTTQGGSTGQLKRSLDGMSAPSAEAPAAPAHRSRAAATLQHYHYTAWPDHGVPTSPEPLLRLCGELRRSGAHGAPIVVHCSGGRARRETGASGACLLLAPAPARALCRNFNLFVQVFQAACAPARLQLAPCSRHRALGRLLRSGHHHPPPAAPPRRAPCCQRRGRRGRPGGRSGSGSGGGGGGGCGSSGGRPEVRLRRALVGCGLYWLCRRAFTVPGACGAALQLACTHGPAHKQTSSAAAAPRCPAAPNRCCPCTHHLPPSRPTPRVPPALAARPPPPAGASAAAWCRRASSMCSATPPCSTSCDSWRRHANQSPGRLRTSGRQPSELQRRCSRAEPRRRQQQQAATSSDPPCDTR